MRVGCLERQNGLPVTVWGKCTFGGAIIARFWGRRQKEGPADDSGGDSLDPSAGDSEDERDVLETVAPLGAAGREGSTPGAAEPSHFEHITPLKRAILRKMYWSDDHINIMSPDKVLDDVGTALSFGVKVTQEEFEAAKRYEADRS